MPLAASGEQRVSRGEVRGRQDRSAGSSRDIPKTGARWVSTAPQRLTPTPKPPQQPPPASTTPPSDGALQPLPRNLDLGELEGLYLRLQQGIKEIDIAANPALIGDDGGMADVAEMLEAEADVVPEPGPGNRRRVERADDLQHTDRAMLLDELLQLRQHA